MPLISSAYKPFSSYPFAGDIQTIIPALFRKVTTDVYRRERILTHDDDFLDLDWSVKGNSRLAILSHGLEGNSKTQYMLGMTKALNDHEWDVLAWNYRGCGGEINRQHRFYHSGETGDLHHVILHAAGRKIYTSIVLIGFSVGGNITLKYLGEQGLNMHQLIKKSVVFSVPCHLASGARQLAKWRSKIYMRRFLKSLHEKIRLKAGNFPTLINDNDFDSIRNFYDFDQRYTAPIHGFRSAEEYWEENSSLYFIEKIRMPTLIISALNDPFLSKECFPFEQAKRNHSVWLETPKGGGHCGFYQNSKNGYYWSELRALEYLK